MYTFSKNTELQEQMKDLLNNLRQQYKEKCEQRHAHIDTPSTWNFVRIPSGVHKHAPAVPRQRNT
jgi:hypothetical protein